MRIALFGAGGQLAAELRKTLRGEIVPLTRREANLTKPESLRNVLDSIQPDIVVNAAAYTDVDRAEREPGVAFAVNAMAPREMARWCSGRDVLLVQFSTDYVFTGDASTESERPRGWKESDPPQPASVYAVSKLAGEHLVSAECPKHLILRSCGLYGHSQNSAKANFVETMLRLGAEKIGSSKQLSVTCDHRCTPTSALDLATATQSLIERGATGLFHATNSGPTTWSEFAAEIFQQAGLAVTVLPTPSIPKDGRAQRPRDSFLDCSRLTGVLGESMPLWQEALQRYLRNRKSGS